MVGGARERSARPSFPSGHLHQNDSSSATNMSPLRRHRSAGTALAVVIAGLAFCLGAAPCAEAHDFWIVPSTFHPAPGGPLAVRLRVGERLRGDPVPRDPTKIERFALVGAAAERPILGPSAAEPAGFAAVPGSGLYQIVYRSRRERVDLPAAKFEDYLTLEGLESISALRKSRGESSKPSTEVYSRAAKSLIWSGAGPGAGSDAGFDRPVGLELELVPEKDPYQLAPGGELPVRLLYRGKPLAGAMVFALDFHHADKTAPDRIAARTGRDGRVALRLPEAGFWLIETVHMISAPQETGVDWESLWASLTFDLPAR
jgi:uncharacterized GH25 family protein